MHTTRITAFGSELKATGPFKELTPRRFRNIAKSPRMKKLPKRFNCDLLKKRQKCEIQVRPSYADKVMHELLASGRCCFYQRVFLIARNAFRQQNGEKAKRPLMGKQEENEVVFEAKESEGLISSDEDFKLQDEVEEEFFKMLRPQIEEIAREVFLKRLSEDHLSALILVFGAHTLMVLEGPEEQIADFCRNLLRRIDCVFLDVRIAHVENRISRPYFEGMVYHRLPVMQLKKTFTEGEANDSEFMTKVHSATIATFKKLCERFSKHFQSESKGPNALDQAQHDINNIQAQPQSVAVEEERQTKTCTNINDQEGTCDSTIPSGPDKKPMLIKSESVETLNISSSSESDYEDEEEDDEGHSTEAQIVEIYQEVNVVESKSNLMPELSVIDDENESLEKQQDIHQDVDRIEQALPDAEHIERMFASTRFYIDLKTFLRYTDEMPCSMTRDIQRLWPEPLHSMPIGIFERSEFDIKSYFKFVPINQLHSMPSEAIMGEEANSKRYLWKSDDEDDDDSDDPTHEYGDNDDLRELLRKYGGLQL